MQFIYPGFLFALSAVSIPIIIHLFNFRRFKRVLFTNVRFLQEIKQDTRSRSRLKNLLILLARILAVIFLVLAFAQPYLPANKNNIVSGVRDVSIFVDNSFSMDAVGKNGSLVEVAKKKAHDIALAYKSSDRFQLLTNDFEGRHQRLVNREEFLQMVDEVKSSASVRKMSEIISRQDDALKNSGEESNGAKKTLYEISDFQKTISDFDMVKQDSNLQVNLLPLASVEVRNLFIDTCWLSSPFVQLNSPNELTVRIKNISNEDAENTPVKLFINDEQRALSSIIVPAHGSAEAKLSFTINRPGWQQAEVNIVDYPVTFDDKYFFSINVKEHLQVLSINETGSSPYVDALFKGDSYFILKNSSVSQLDYSSFASNSLILLNGLKDISSGLSQELKKYMQNGGSVFVFPSVDLNTASYQEFLQAVNSNYYTQLNETGEKVSFIESKHPVFSDVFEKKLSTENLDLPVAKKYFVISKASRNAEEVLLKLSGGNTFLSTTPVGKGQLYLSAVPLNDDFSNFPKHALFVPVMLKAAMLNNSGISSSLLIGSNAEFTLNNVTASGETVFHLSNKKKSFDIIPEIKVSGDKTLINPGDQVKESGNYLLTSNNNTVGVLSFNYDRKESDLTCYPESELKTITEKAGMQSLTLVSGSNNELTHAIIQLNEGKRLWKYCVIFVLLFLAMEVLLIKLM